MYDHDISYNSNTTLRTRLTTETSYCSRAVTASVVDSTEDSTTLTDSSVEMDFSATFSTSSVLSSSTGAASASSASLEDVSSLGASSVFCFLEGEVTLDAGSSSASASTSASAGRFSPEDGSFVLSSVLGTTSSTSWVPSTGSDVACVFKEKG